MARTEPLAPCPYCGHLFYVTPRGLTDCHTCRVLEARA
jgi:hypothetical protein